MLNDGYKPSPQAKGQELDTVHLDELGQMVNRIERALQGVHWRIKYERGIRLNLRSTTKHQCHHNSLKCLDPGTTED